MVDADARPPPNGMTSSARPIAVWEVRREKAYRGPGRNRLIRSEFGMDPANEPQLPDRVIDQGKDERREEHLERETEDQRAGRQADAVPRIPAGRRSPRPSSGRKSQGSAAREPGGSRSTRTRGGPVSPALRSSMGVNSAKARRATLSRWWISQVEPTRARAHTNPIGLDLADPAARNPVRDTEVDQRRYEGHEVGGPGRPGQALDAIDQGVDPARRIGRIASRGPSAGWSVGRADRDICVHLGRSVLSPHGAGSLATPRATLAAKRQRTA